MNDKKEINIGTKFYIYDINRRVYTDPETGEKSSGGPIWKYSWVEHEIVDETKVSWIDDYGRKWKKKDFLSNWIMFSIEDIDKVDKLNKVLLEIHIELNYMNRPLQQPEHLEYFQGVLATLKEIKGRS